MFGPRATGFVVYNNDQIWRPVVLRKVLLASPPQNPDSMNATSVQMPDLRNSLRISRAVWSSLNVYTMCKHNDSNRLARTWGNGFGTFGFCRALSKSQLAPKVVFFAKAQLTRAHASRLGMFLCLYEAPRKGYKKDNEKLGISGTRFWRAGLLSILCKNT